MALPNIAVVGTGYISGEHIKAIAESSRATLHTICSSPRSEATGQALAREYRAQQATSTYDAVLTNSEVDVVYLCTPNSQHVSQAVAALQAGKDLFVEKPLAVTAADCGKVVKAARDARRQVMVGHGARFSAIFETIHKLVHDGTLGDPCFVEGDYVHDLGPFLDVPGHDWWMDTEREGQLPIIGGACHPLDLMRWIAGEITEVTAYGANRNIPQAPWYDTVVAGLKFESGAIGKCLVSCGAKIPYAMNFSYYGTRGSIVNDRLYLDGIPNVEGYMTLPVQIRPEDHTCAQELDHFLDCLETGATPLIDAADGARSVAVCCAIARSIESGRPEPVFLDF